MNTSILRLCLPLAVILPALAGCRATHSLKGKVIEGNLSFVAVVSQSDERLKSQGVAGADVAARLEVGRVGGNLAAQTETNEKGDFTLDFKEQSVLMKPLEFSGSKVGYRSATGMMSLPPADRRLLIILVPSGPPPSGSR